MLLTTAPSRPPLRASMETIFWMICFIPFVRLVSSELHIVVLKQV
jgi:hypothetical protein